MTRKSLKACFHCAPLNIQRSNNQTKQQCHKYNYYKTVMHTNNTDNKQHETFDWACHTKNYNAIRIIRNRKGSTKNIG